MRDTKRFIIASTYFAILVALGLFVYFAFIKAPETCLDNKKNQNETGIDCGGICTNVCEENIVGEALEIQEVAFVTGGVGIYDVLARVYNPNDEIGALSFQYVFTLKDAAGNVLAEKSGISFILPQETKTLMELNIPSTGVPATATFTASNAEWKRFSGYQDKPQINIYQRRYDQISSGAGFGEAYGLVSNESPYDFRNLYVKVILRDEAGRPLALNMTEMRSVKANEERDFRLLWPVAFPGTVATVEMEADADIYNSDNFMRQHLPGGKFQEFSK